MALLTGNKVLVQDRVLRDRLMQRGFGEKNAAEFALDLYEALFLVEKEKLAIEVPADGRGRKKGKMKFESLLEYSSGVEKNFYQKFLVYRDLRERGYCIKTGFKFGFDFRVYPRGKKPGQAHTQWVVNVATQQGKWSMPEFSRMVRLSGNIKTTMLQAVVDSENDINYYEIQRVTP